MLTASDATQYSFEGDKLLGSGSASVFTRHLVEGLRTGAADQDGRLSAVCADRVRALAQLLAARVAKG